MKCIIPFESKVKFDYPVKEICSISLEHEITKNDDELLGNFFISGTCKEHELSVNTNDFKFTIPFSLEYTNKIDPDSIDFNIDNFTYDLSANELIIKIDYEISADDIVEDDPYDLIDENYRDTSNIIDNNFENAKNENSVIVEKPKETMSEYPKNEIGDIKNDIASLKMEDDYALYHVHYKKVDETIESICSFYKISKDDLLNFNNTDNVDDLSILLIPIKDE